MKKTLEEVYEANLNYLARWDTSLANHVSMAAAAMFLMREKTQVEARKIRCDAATYSESLSPKRVNAAFIKLEGLTWSIQQQLLGHDDLQESWLTFFRNALDQDVDLVIAVWLQRLGYGISAAAGHSIIRIHYAMAVRDALSCDVFKEELAISFADLASRYTVLTLGNIAERKRSLEDYIDDHPSLPASVVTMIEHGSLIEDRLFLVKTNPIYQSTVQGIALNYDIVQCLRRLAVIAKKTADFTLLHTITVGQALIDIMRWCPALDNLSLRQGYRDFVVAAVFANNLPNVTLDTENETTIDEVYAEVPNLTNDHSQKITYSLTKLYEEFAYPEFLQAARVYQKKFR
jgi:hypothetical protein